MVFLKLMSVRCFLSVSSIRIFFKGVLNCEIILILLLAGCKLRDVELPLMVGIGLLDLVDLCNFNDFYLQVTLCALLVCLWETDSTKLGASLPGQLCLMLVMLCALLSRIESKWEFDGCFWFSINKLIYVIKCCSNFITLFSYLHAVFFQSKIKSVFSTSSLFPYSLPL